MQVGGVRRRGAVLRALADFDVGSHHGRQMVERLGPHRPDRLGILAPARRVGQVGQVLAEPLARVKPVVRRPRPSSTPHHRGQQWLCGVRWFLGRQSDDVRPSGPTEDLLAARGRDLRRGQFHHGPAVVLDELVRGVQVRGVRGGAHLRAHGVRVDGGSGAYEPVHAVLVEAAAGHDPYAGQPGGVEQGARPS